ncbi:FdhF/YdeP family oxidoreductase [Gordonia paraffinivorans]|uniref:FdhF/YdeP family oxidoreductase n=1 Tax=Gordonia paraffinivorans TaxID=175628 RepID=UPI001445DC69|nr:FdhF/YdeP family oxidoreductase [Gordonia paraffinivorans]MCD2143861.1 FdhF/YdeP family oxidoreductase [Gordonia paraffinivorans]
MTVRPPEKDFTDANLKVGPPKTWAVGLPAIEHAMLPALGELDPERTAKVAFSINHKAGFDCPSCAWANPDRSKPLEFCENGMKSVVWESAPATIPTEFWQRHSLADLAEKSEYWLGLQGRVVEPVYKAPDSDHYVPIGWDEALDLVADKLRSLDDPDQAVFYTSGRITNEPAFLYQLFARAYGTNNLPDCSNMCHEATGAGMTAAIGVGKSTVHYDDFAKADLVMVMGQNPGTNHPRMLNALQDCKVNGGKMIGVNVLPEASLLRYKNPQKPIGLIGDGIAMSDQFLHIRIGGDMHLIQAIAKRVLLAEQLDPGNVLDWDFINTYCEGFEEYRDHILALDDDEVLDATGLTAEEIDTAARHYLDSDATIITWALGITQHRKAVGTIAEIMNLLMLKGNIGKPGAGASPIRGHSNVQGDRTMGVWEQMPQPFLDRLGEEFSFTPPTEHGLDSVDAMNAMERGDIRFFMSMAGNLQAAISDSNRADSGIGNVDLTVSVTTKLNRSHAVTGKASLLLPALGRTEYDVQKSGRQFTTVEDTVCFINESRGELPPISDGVRSDVWILCELGKRLLGDTQIPWQEFQDDYDTIRDRIARVIPGFENFNGRLRTGRRGFLLAHPPRDSRTFPTPTGKARFTVHTPEHITCPPGRLILQTLRSHDQHNTTMYGLDDRYRGISQGRFVVFVNPDDLAELGLADGDTVDVFSEWPDSPDRVLRGYRAVSYPTKKGCAALYFPEGNALIPRESVAEGCNTPTSKQVIVRLERSDERAATGRPVTV